MKDKISYFFDVRRKHFHQTKQRKMDGINEFDPSKKKKEKEKNPNWYK